MKTRQLLVAAAVLLGGVYVAAQVESPGNSDTTKTPDEVSASTSTTQPDGDLERGFENSSSTSTYDPSGARPAGEKDIGLPDRERMENRRERGGPGADRDTGTPSETDTDSGSEDDESSDAEEDKTGPRNP